MRALLVLAALLAATAPASAGSADAPEVTDPAGDAGPNGAAVPAGFEDLDIVAAWFENENADTIDLVIKTAGPSRSRPNADWWQEIESNGTAYLAGYLDFPGPLGYVGPYLCPKGNAPAGCIGTGGGVSGDTLRSTLPRANLSQPALGDALTIVGGASQVIVGLQWVSADPTPAGIPYVLAKGVAAGNVTTADGAAGLDAAGNATVSPAGGDAATEAAVPATPLAAFLVAAGALALGRRRRAA